VVGNPDTPSSTHRLDTNAIIHGTSDSLFAAKVSLGRLDRDVAEQELDLFQFSSCRITKACTCSTEIVWREFFDFSFPRVFTDHMPDCLFRQSRAPGLPSLVN
jgi:hypothetical protein